VIVKRFLASLDFPVQIPTCFLKVLHPGFEIRSPNVFDGVAKIEAHMLGDLDALNARRMLSVVLWVVYGIVAHE
jgi:hypothetical protein